MQAFPGMCRFCEAKITLTAIYHAKSKMSQRLRYGMYSEIRSSCGQLQWHACYEFETEGGKNLTQFDVYT